jgi:Fe-S cluster assembly protein SufD
MTTLAPDRMYAEQFVHAKTRLPGAGLKWLATLRDEAMERFSRSGFPTPKVEAWKFTNLNRLAQITFQGAEAAPGEVTRAAITPYRLTSEGPLVVFVNGRLRPDLSDLERLPLGMRLVDLSAASEDELKALTAPLAVTEEPRARALADLNTALMSGGAVVQVDSDISATPVQLLFVAAPGHEPPVFHLRNLIQVEAGAGAALLESYVGSGEDSYWTNVVTQIVVAPNATLRHGRLQAEGPHGFHSGESSVRVGRDARYRIFATSVGAELARHEIDVALEAPGAEARLSGITLARGDQHLDTTTRLSHARPHGTSRQEFRSVVDERAHAVFQGSIRVAPNAQKTDARQLNHNLLLSAAAAADTKPELEILADDVQCSHGASVGDLDREALFYMRTRGIGEIEARALLIEGFLGELLRELDDPVRDYFRRTVDRWLQERPI